MPTLRGRRLFLAAFLAVLGGLCLPSGALAQRYPIERYTTAEGLPSPRVRALAQDATGFLWFGTGSGLARYDGDQIEQLLATGAAAGGIVALEANESGGLWAATRNGLVGEWSDGVLRPVVDLGSRGVRLRGLGRDVEGALWVAMDGGALRVDADGGVTEFGSDAEGCCRFVRRDRGGAVWAGGDSGLATLRDGRFVPVDIGIPDGAGVNVLLEDNAGTLWAGTDRGLYRETAGRFKSFPSPFGDRPVVLSATIGPRGRLWFGTERGAFRFAGAVDRTLTSRNGLPDDRVNGIMFDHEGTVWFATDGGVGKLVESSFATYTTAQGLAGDYVVDVDIDEEGRVWVAGRSGVAVLESGGFERMVDPGSATVTAFARDRSGALLVGTSRGLVLRRGGDSRWIDTARAFGGAEITAVRFGPDDVWVGTSDGLYRGDGVDFEPAATEGGLAGAHVTTLVEDRVGRLWVGTVEHGLWVRAGETFVAVHPDELDGLTIWDLAPGGRDLVWVATNGEGVLAVRGDPPFTLSREIDGLASDHVPQLVVDRDGDLWIYTNQGLYRWEPRVGPTPFRIEDGLVDLAATPGAGAVGPDGRLWFGTPSGLTVYEPGPDRTVEASPRVVLREVRVDHTPVEGAVDLDHTSRELTIGYTALSFRREQDTRFQYRLLGQSDDWSPITKQRQVTFGELPPGSYEFQVRAITARGDWSAEPATLAIRVSPAFWESNWFRGLVAALVLALLLLVFRTRLRRVEDERQRLRLMVDRRTRELVEKNSLLERMATTDELTGLPNRRFFLDSMERELRKLSRTPTPQPLSLLVLDIDRFKAINDRHGHAAGDEVLRRLGRRLSQSVRATDLPARYGGEEFAILLPATDAEGARFLAEKLRGEVEEMDVRYEGRRIPVTISLGISSVPGAVRYEREVEEELLRRADEAMYRAKEGGRNRVVVDEDAPDAAGA